MALPRALPRALQNPLYHRDNSLPHVFVAAVPLFEKTCFMAARGGRRGMGRAGARRPGAAGWPRGPGLGGGAGLDFAGIPSRNSRAYASLQSPCIPCTALAQSQVWNEINHITGPCGPIGARWAAPAARGSKSLCAEIAFRTVLVQPKNVWRSRQWAEPETGGSDRKH